MSTNRRGQSLVEFAIISLVLTLIVAGLLGLAIMLMQGTMTANASISASMLFDQQINQSEVQTTEDIYQRLRDLNLYDDAALVLTKDQYESARDGTDANFPRLNQKMLGLYQWDPDRQRYRYPGTVVTYNGAPAILIPKVEYDESETITAWYRPVQIDYTPGQIAVDVTLYMASQPAALMSYPVDADGFSIGNPIEANDDTVVVTAALPTGFNFDATVVEQTEIASVNRGNFGLGELYAYNTSVRPYRVVISNEGTFRLVESESP